MPLPKKWARLGARVITPHGYGKLISHSCPSESQYYSVELEEPVDGKKEILFKPGQIVLDTDFTIVRVISVSGWNFVITSAVNYPRWHVDVLEELKDHSYIEDETLLGFNFETGELVCNRERPAIGPYCILNTWYDMHAQVQPLFFESFGDAQHTWQEIVEPLPGTRPGTSGNIFLYVFFDLDSSKIFARALFSTFRVLKKNTFDT